MSTSKSFACFAFLFIIFCFALPYSVEGVPMPKKVYNATRMQPMTRTTKRPTGRNARFLGKFSLLAGLGLPDPVTLPINRNDFIYDQRVAVPQFTANYNFPPARWGPYIAAVYEPLPIVTWLQNSLAYLARLNPFNWFNNSDGVGTSTSSPEIVTVTTDKDQDNIVVLVDMPENEIPNEERGGIRDKMETKMDQDIFDSQKYVMNTPTSDSLLITKDDVTFTNTNAVNSNADLIAEETTIKLLEDMKMDRNFEDDSRQAGNRPGGNRTTTRATTTIKVTPTTSKVFTTTVSDTTNTTNAITATDATLMSENSTIANITTTEVITTMTTANTTSNATQPLTSYPTPTLYPGSINGYYYGGYPQNISNLEFTTPATPNPVIPPARFQHANNLNLVPQQLPANYYDANEVQPQAALDYYSRYDNFAPEFSDYYNRNNELLPSNGNNFERNGFRPSFPHYF